MSMITCATSSSSFLSTFLSALNGVAVATPGDDEPAARGEPDAGGEAAAAVLGEAVAAVLGEAVAAVFGEDVAFAIDDVADWKK